MPALSKSWNLEHFGFGVFRLAVLNLYKPARSGQDRDKQDPFRVMEKCDLAARLQRKRIQFFCTMP
jgi:hypothetical protein